MKGALFILSCVFAIQWFYLSDTLFSSPSQPKIQKSEKAIEIFCSKIDPDNLHCQKRTELKLKRLELKSLIYKEFEKFCKANPQNKYCLQKKLPNIFVICNFLFSHSPHCQEWQALKQQELENKNFLYEEIEKFCKAFPKHSFCK